MAFAFGPTVRVVEESYTTGYEEGFSDGLRLGRTEINDLKRQLDNQRRNNEERNRALDALHFVWCEGGCPKGVHRYTNAPDEVTEAMVEAGERQIERLRTWFETNKVRRETK